MWVYRSPIGNLYIREQTDGSYGLIYRNCVWESSDSPQIEADNVYMHVTGCHEWDSLCGKVSDVPHDLSEWETV